MKRAAIGLLLLSQLSYGQTINDSIEKYSNHVHKTYSESLTRAKSLQRLIKQFTDEPSVLTLSIAQEAWKFARAPYGKSEVFRFYNGPIDRDGGPEGLLNSWPLDEAYIDYVEGRPDAGIINDLTDYPVINKELLVSLNELDGEKNISTGYHAIEFLLWGQDFYTDGPGQRSFTDYTTAPNAERRAAYLNIAADLLVSDLETLESEWKPNTSNYRQEFTSLKDTTALKKILSGVIFMAGDELSGERMYVAYDTQGQEDEHSCFSDMTHMDITWNYQGIEEVIRATGILELPQVKGTQAAKNVEARLQSMPAVISAIPVPFDQAIQNDDSREKILTTVEELEGLARDLAIISEMLGAKVDY